MAGAVLVIGAMAVSSPPSPDGGNDPASVWQRDRADLAAALTATGGQSYRFTVESELSVPALGIHAERERCSGMLDPVSRAGQMRLRDLEQWAVGGQRYLRIGGERHTLGAGGPDRFIACPIGQAGTPGFLSVEPATLLQHLSGLPGARRISGGIASTYAFTGSGSQILVIVRDARVRSLTSAVDSPDRAGSAAYRRTFTMSLSGFGDPMNSHPPW